MDYLTISEIKKIQLELLETLNNYCEKNKLSYYLTYGTLIGAIRHKGYIPWDDDIDVMMPRADYEKLLADFNQSTKSQIKVMSHEIDSRYYLSFAKLIDTKTVLQEDVNSDFEIGVNIDIFPIDNLSDSFETALQCIKKAFRYNEILMLKNMTLNKNRSWHKNAIIIIGRLISCLWSRDMLIDIINKFGKQRADGSITKYVGTVTGITEGDERDVFESGWFRESIKVDFEGRQYNAPVGYDAFLRNMFGDYMQFPPVEEQIPHHAFKAWYK